MKLSEAIRLGSMLHPQHFGDMHGWETDGDKIVIASSCALGAAMDAGYLIDIKGLLDTYTICPACLVSAPPTGRVQATIVHLNELHKWTRERIADWIESIEMREESLSEQSKKDETLELIKV